MDLMNIDGVKVYIIESLKSPDIRTGENLKDQFRLICYLHFTPHFHPPLRKPLVASGKS